MRIASLFILCLLSINGYCQEIQPNFLLTLPKNSEIYTVAVPNSAIIELLVVDSGKNQMNLAYLASSSPLAHAMREAGKVGVENFMEIASYAGLKPGTLLTLDSQPINGFSKSQRRFLTHPMTFGILGLSLLASFVIQSRNIFQLFQDTARNQVPELAVNPRYSLERSATLRGMASNPRYVAYNPKTQEYKFNQGKAQNVQIIKNGKSSALSFIYHGIQTQIPITEPSVNKENILDFEAYLDLGWELNKVVARLSKSGEFKLSLVEFIYPTTRNTIQRPFSVNNTETNDLFPNQSNEPY